MPIYKITHLSNGIAGDGTILDGDDDIWMGQCNNLGQGNWQSLTQPATYRKQSHSPSPGSEMSSNKWVCSNLMSMAIQTPAC